MACDSPLSWGQAVLNWVRQIAPGRVMTYGQLAILTDRPRAARQVGTLLRHCQDSELSWHRVINIQGGSRC